MKNNLQPRYNDGKYKKMEYFLKGFRAPLFKLLNFNSKYKFQCPICNYRGPFMRKNNRPFAKCPKCGELERTRLASLVLESIYSDQKASKTDVLHISPENSLRKKFQKNYKSYISADLHRKDVDRQFDVQNIPFSDESFDLVFASHVLEYPEDDRKAMSEIRRILRKDGIAILPVPLIHKKTKDNIERNPTNRMMHEPGLDFFERYKDFFSSVKIYDPESFDPKFNLHEHETLNLLPVCKV